MLDHNNLEEFAYPADYDAEYGAFEPEGPFYVALAHEVGGPILELACGTGRVAIPLAQAGFAVVGVDIEPGMLAHARHKAGDLAIQWVDADCRDFHLARTFRLIYMTGHAFQAFLTRTDLEALLACVREHLQPEGYFAFETRNPRLADLAADHSQEAAWGTFRDSMGRTVHASGTARYDHVTQLRHYTIYRRRDGDNGQTVLDTARIAIRYHFPQELQALLDYNGFVIERCYGNWDRSPLGAASPEMIYVCRRKAV